MRLRKFFSYYTTLSNQQIRNAWKEGKIVIQNPLHKEQKNEEEESEDDDPLTRIIFPEEEVFLDNQKVLPIPPQRYYFALHKPGN